MNKTAIIAAILLYGIGVSEIPKDGFVSFKPSYDEDIFKQTGRIKFTKGMDVKLNGELITTVDDNGQTLFAYSLKNKQLTLAFEVIKAYEEPYTIMYTIDIENKKIKNEERLNKKYTYKDSDLELSIIGNFHDTNTAVMQYTWKGKTDKIVLSAEMKTIYKIYISKNGYLVCRNYDGLSSSLYVFSMDKKKFTNIGRFTHESFDFYVPLNEYIIYVPYQNFTEDKFYLYRYAEEELYATRYQKANSETKDTIISNMRKGNIYEQFFPLTRVENIDSMVNANSLKALVDYRRKK